MLEILFLATQPHLFQSENFQLPLRECQTIVSIPRSFGTLYPGANLNQFCQAFPRLALPEYWHLLPNTSSWNLAVLHLWKAYCRLRICIAVVRRCHYWSTGTWRFRISRNVGSDTKRLHYLGVVPRMQPQSSRSLEDVSSFVRRDCEWNICGTPKHLYLGCSMFLLLRNLYSASVELQNGHVLVTPTYMAGSTALLGLPILAAKFLVMMFGRLRNYQGRETIANISLIKECTSLNSKFALIVASVSSFRAFW